LIFTFLLAGVIAVLIAARIGLGAVLGYLLAGIAIALGLPWPVAPTAGLVLALSSTAFVLQTLKEKGLPRSDGGRSAFSVCLFQDIAVIPMLAFIPLLALPELAGVVAGSGEEVANGSRPSAIDNNIVDFRYALGHWRECQRPTWDSSCDSRRLSSSPGALGWNP
jgi:CPA2 family monovalent cation:H+ antiporter-2